MASITVDLGAPVGLSSRIVWTQVIDIGPTFDADGVGQSINQLSITFSGGNAGLIGLSISGVGNRFTPAFEASGRLIFEASDGEILEVTIGGADTSEPYSWTPANSADAVAFAIHIDGLTDRTATLTLTDDPLGVAAPSFSDDTGDAQNWTQNVAIAPITVPPASGSPTPTYAVVGSPPAGISFSPSTRVISGTPTAIGSGTIRIRATNSEGSDDWTVAYTVTAVPSTVPDQPTGLAATAAQGNVPLAWDDPGDSSITSYQILRRDVTGGGSLAVHINSVPAGTSYTDATDVLDSNTYSYRIKARNAQGLSPQSGFVNVTTLAAPTTDTAPVFADDTGNAQTWRVGNAITSITIPAASGNPTPTYAVVGSPPAGISFSPSTRVISGTPTATGSGTLTIRATNSEGSDDWTVAYATAAEIITPPPPPPPPIIPVTPRKAVPSWGFTATMFGSSVDLTPYVLEATWKHGSRPANYFGHLADPAVGALTLYNGGGEFKTFSPDPFVDTTPGPPVTVSYDGVTLFTGKAGLMLNQVLRNGRDTAVMPLLGPLAFLARFSEGIFARLNGVQSTSDVFSIVLQDAGYDGPTSIETGRTELSSIRLNKSSLLGSGRRRVQVLGALRTIVQAEVGRAFDDRKGRVVFENRTHRSGRWASRPGQLRLDASNSLIERASIASIDDQIVNLISGTGDSYNSLGIQDVDFVDTTLPMTYFIPTGGRIIILSVDTSGSTEFVQSWEDLLSPVDYTYTLNLQPDIERGDSTIGIYIPNPSPVPQTFVLKQVRGEPFGVAIRERIFARREASIDAYGPRPVIYPTDLLTEVDEIRDHLEWALSVHDGISHGRKNLSEVKAISCHYQPRRPGERLRDRRGHWYARRGHGATPRA